MPERIQRRVVERGKCVIYQHVSARIGHTYESGPGLMLEHQEVPGPNHYREWL